MRLAEFCYLGVVFAALSAPLDAQTPVRAADSTAITGILADLDAAWHAGDASRWVVHFAPEVRFVNVAGMMMADRAALEERMNEIFKGVFRGSRHVGTLRYLRLLGADAAIADEDIEITSFAALPPGIRPTAPGVLRTRMRHVLRRTDGRWLIVASQNTAVAPAP